MILEITVGTLSFAFRKSLTHTLRQELLDGIQDRYLLDDSNGIKTTWDQIQLNFNCCGVNNYTDWYQISAWPSENWVPNSCCIPVTHNETEYEIEDEEQCGKNPDLTVSRFRRHGCYYKIRYFVVNNLHIVGLTSIVVAFIQFVAIVGALLIVCIIRWIIRNETVQYLIITVDQLIIECPLCNQTSIFFCIIYFLAIFNIIDFKRISTTICSTNNFYNVINLKQVPLTRYCSVLITGGRLYIFC